MAGKSRLEASGKDIFQYFNHQECRVYHFNDLRDILEFKRNSWHLAKATNAQAFIDFLLDHTPLEQHGVTYKDKVKYIYCWGKATLYEVALGLKKNAYLSHGTAMYLHGLVDRSPSVLYVNQEQALKSGESRDPLSQAAINAAFKNEPRISANKAFFEAALILFLNGKFTNRLGIEKKVLSPVEQVDVTNIGRTLIDIAVRPAYAGGVLEVLKAYERAAPWVSIQEMVKLLKGLHYIYPYQQAIGFYLEQTGCYNPSQMDMFKSLVTDLDFYLTHDGGELAYSKEWKLYYPKILRS